MNLSIMSAFILYFITLISIAFYFYRHVKTASQFIAGNHSVNYWVTAIATQASDMGSWLFLAFPAAIYSKGLFESWVAIGLVFFMFLNWYFIAPRLRTISEETESITLSQLFEKQFHDTTGLISIVSAFLTVLFFIFYIASGLVGLGRLFESAFDISYHTGIIAALATAVVYTLLGGFIAAAWCDLFQGIFLLCVIIIVPLVAFFHTQGLDAIIETAHSHNLSLSLLSSPSDMVKALSLACGWGLGYFGQPHILINFIGIDDPKKIKAATVVGLSWQIAVLCAAIAIGFVGLAFFPDTLANPELLFILMTKTLFYPFIAGLALCGILAATLSTMDRHILISGSVIAADIYKKLINKTAPSRHVLFILRCASASVSLVALAIAWNDNTAIYNLVNYAWSGLGSSFGPLVICALYGGKNITRQGALAGLIVGGLTSALWPFGATILPLIPGFVFNMITLYSVSYITKK